MLRLRNITPVFLMFVLLGCQQQETEETAAEPTSSEVDIVEYAPSELPSRFYALRPLDDSWPANVDAEQLSANLQAANYYIVMDGSGSMQGRQCSNNDSKMTVAKHAVGQFAQQIPNASNLALYVFDAQGYSERVPFAEQNRDEILAAIGQVKAGGVTPLQTAIAHAYQALQRQAEKQLGYGEYHLVVVTDGIASDNQDPTPVVASILQQSPMLIHTIGFCIEEQHSLNQPGMTSYKSANSPEELQQGLQAVLSEAPNFSPDSF